MNYILGSTSLVKVSAVRAALSETRPAAVLHQVSVPSLVATQPVGAEETLRGARNRARQAQALLPGASAIGIENGIRLVNDRWEDWAIVVLISPEGKECVAESASIPFPSEAVEVARLRGFDQTTVGAVLHEQYGADEHDPHTFLTKGVYTRADLLRETLIHLLHTQEVSS